MTESTAEVIHSLCTTQAEAFACASDLLPETYQNKPERILAACMIAHALDLNPATVMFGLHLKTPATPAQKAEKQEKPEKQEKVEPVDDSWPRLIDGAWTDSTGVVYVDGKHAFSKKAKMPSVKADGTFRHSRSNGKAGAMNKSPDTVNKSSDPAAHDDEQAIVDANQILGSFKTHVTDASTSERLGQIGEQIELMGFNPSELTIARRWIAERAEAITA